MLAAQAMSDINELEKRREKDESVSGFKMCTVTVCLYSTYSRLQRTLPPCSESDDHGPAKVMIMDPTIKLGP
jgi:hypothetical protein